MKIKYRTPQDNIIIHFFSGSTCLLSSPSSVDMKNACNSTTRFHRDTVSACEGQGKIAVSII